MADWLWPLPGHNVPLGPILDSEDPGSFGYDGRKHSRHTGVDLRVPKDATVVAVEPGRVVAVILFTGPRAESDFYLETFAVLVEGPSGVVVYGEIDPCVVVGQVVVAGQMVGSVMDVLPEDKGFGTSMVHMELHDHGTTDVFWWHHGQPKPPSLRDPTPFLLPLVT